MSSRRFLIAAYSICKDEESNVGRWLESTRHCDFRSVVDTGSRDRTVEKLRAAGVRVTEASWDPFRFDEARNLAIANVPPEFEWLMSPDFDETFDEGWRESLESALSANPGATQVTHPVMIYHGDSVYPGLNPGNKIHRRGYRWVQPVHEYLVHEADTAELAIHSERILMRHVQDSKKPREENYFELARRHLEIDPENDWLIWFVFRGWFLLRKDPERIIEFGRRYLSRTRPYTEFRSIAHQEIGKAIFALSGPTDECLTELFRAVAENPDNRDAWACLGQASEARGDLPTSVLAYSRLPGALETGSSYYGVLRRLADGEK